MKLSGCISMLTPAMIRDGPVDCRLDGVSGVLPINVIFCPDVKFKEAPEVMLAVEPVATPDCRSIFCTALPVMDPVAVEIKARDPVANGFVVPERVRAFALTMMLPEPRVWIRAC